MRRCVCSTSLTNEDVMARVSPQRHEKRNKKGHVADFVQLVQARSSLFVDVVAVCGSDPN